MTKLTLIMQINSENYNPKEIQDILKLTEYDFELIIINSSKKLKINLEDTRVRIEETDNSKLMQTFNKSINNAKGKYVYFTNTLNVLLDDTLKKGCNKLEETADLLIYSKNMNNSTIISRLVSDKTFNYHNIKEFLLTLDYSIHNYLFAKEFLLSKKLSFDENKRDDSIVFVTKSILKAENILLFNDEFKISESNNLNDINYFKQHLDNIEDIQKLFYDYRDEILIKQSNNYRISESLKQYDKTIINNKKEAFSLLKFDFNEILMSDDSEKFISSLTRKNRKSFEQVIITESVEEYELLKKLSQEKKHIYNMQRYEQLLKNEDKKISELNKQLTSSSSWKLTKIFRIINHK